VLAGLGIQLACFGLFMIISIRFNFTSKRFSDDSELMGMNFVGRKGRDKHPLKRDWWTLLRVVNLGCILILVSVPAP
jgi:hypothetical protein